MVSATTASVAVVNVQGFLSGVWGSVERCRLITMLDDVVGYHFFFFFFGYNGYQKI
jgi:hypothetical protein